MYVKFDCKFNGSLFIGPFATKAEADQHILRAKELGSMLSTSYVTKLPPGPQTTNTPEKDLDILLRFAPMNHNHNHNRNRNLLIIAYQVIDGIPDNRINLDFWLEGVPDPNDCKTIACAGGWLALNPEFQKLGLSITHGTPSFKGLYGFKALGKLFNISTEDAQEIFCCNLNEAAVEHMSDKEIWKNRVKQFLKETS